MLEDTKTALERWGGVHTLIDRWLEQRRDMLVTLVELQEAHQMLVVVMVITQQVFV